jgi:hypothetical protein
MGVYDVWIIGLYIFLEAGYVAAVAAETLPFDGKVFQFYPYTFQGFPLGLDKRGDLKKLRIAAAYK